MPPYPWFQGMEPNCKDDRPMISDMEYAATSAAKLLALSVDREIAEAIVEEAMSTSRLMDFKQSEVVVLSEGEYDDYGMLGVVVVLKDFNGHDQLKLWAKDTGRTVDPDGTVRDTKTRRPEFIPWLIDKGFITKLEYRELHMGCYGDTYLT